MTSKRLLGKYDHKKGEWLKSAKYFVAVFIVLFLVFRFLIGISYVSGNSMYPTLENGEAVVYNRLAKNYEKGDIVSIRMPSGNYYIKRIAAVEGDTVDIIDDVLYINGEADETYGTTPKQTGVVYPLTIGEGMVFALGDNRPDSVDSRTFGELAETQIRGKILFHFSLPF